jgi:hypothetical protein
VIVIDVSMSTIDRYRDHWLTAPPTNPPKGSILDAELEAAVDFLEASDPERVAVGLVAFAGEPPSKSGKPPAWVEVPLTTDYSLVRAGLERLRERGGGDRLTWQRPWTKQRSNFSASGARARKLGLRASRPHSS